MVWVSFGGHEQAGAPAHVQWVGGGEHPPQAALSVVLCIRQRMLSFLPPFIAFSGAVNPPFHNSATAVAKLPRLPLLLRWGGISKALLIKEQQFLCVEGGEINEQAVASDINGFLWHLRRFPGMLELYGSLFVSSIGDIPSLLGLAGAGSDVLRWWDAAARSQGIPAACRAPQGTPG